MGMLEKEKEGGVSKDLGESMQDLLFGSHKTNKTLLPAMKAKQVKDPTKFDTSRYLGEVPKNLTEEEEQAKQNQVKA